MWWRELQAQARAHSGLEPAAGQLRVDPTATVAADAVLDTSRGPIVVGPGTMICRGAYIEGPVTIGADCMIGNLAMIRGTTVIGEGTRIGFAAEIKNAIIEEGVTIGPQCFVADSKIEHGSYLGAQVRTSNHRLDRQTVKVFHEGEAVDTGMEKLGCLVGAGASLGIQVIVLPGRMISPGSIIGPRMTVEKNLPPGRYRLAQRLETY